MPDTFVFDYLIRDLLNQIRRNLGMQRIKRNRVINDFLRQPGLKFLLQKLRTVNPNPGHLQAHDNNVLDIDLAVSVLINGLQNSLLGLLSQ